MDDEATNIEQFIRLLWRRASRKAFQVRDDGDRVFMFQVVLVHGRTQRKIVGSDRLLEDFLALLFRVRGKSSESGRALRPVRVRMHRHDPNGSALQPARVVQIATRGARRMTLAAFRHLLDEVTAALDLAFDRGGWSRRCCDGSGFAMKRRSRGSGRCERTKTRKAKRFEISREMSFSRGFLPTGERIASDAQLGMLQMEVGGLLVGASEGEQATFAVELTEKSEASGSARATVVAFDFAFVIFARGRSVVTAKTIRQDHGGVAREIRDDNCWLLVGATITSNPSRVLATASMASIRARFAWIYSTAGIRRAVRNVFGQSPGP